MPSRRLALLAFAVLLAAAPRAAGAAERWQWPVRGEVLTPFHTTGDPFAGGQHRGIDIAARAGARVVAACGGVVRFAGRLPGRGRAVSVLCGALVATHLELGATTVRRGQRVVAGMPIGTAAASHVQLGARRAGRRHGYLDPLTLLGPAPPPALGPVPPARRPGPLRPHGAGPRREALRSPRPDPLRAPVAEPGRAPSAGREASPSPAPAAAWAGVALLGAATPAGALVRRRRRRAAARVATQPR